MGDDNPTDDKFEFAMDAPLGTSTPVDDGSVAAQNKKKPSIRFVDEPIAKVHVRPSLPINLEGESFHNVSTCLPEIPDSEEAYQPILYTFRVPPSTRQRKVRTMRVRSPPFYLQLDHAIAVIWTLFSQSTNKNLGVAQLQWALAFFKSIYNRSQEHPKDIELCIQTIEDNVIEQYAELANDLNVLGAMEKSQTMADAESVQVEAQPFSPNYFAMMEKYGSLKESGLTGGLFSSMDETMTQEIGGLKKVCGAESVELLTSKSKEAAIDYLTGLKQEHIDNIGTEIRRLHSIENLMKNIIPDTFGGYTDETKFSSLFKGEDDEDSDYDEAQSGPTDSEPKSSGPESSGPEDN